MTGEREAVTAADAAERATVSPAPAVATVQTLEPGSGALLRQLSGEVEPGRPAAGGPRSAGAGLTPELLLALQGSTGNAAVARLVGGTRPAGAEAAAAPGSTPGGPAADTTSTGRETPGPGITTTATDPAPASNTAAPTGTSSTGQGTADPGTAAVAAPAGSNGTSTTAAVPAPAGGVAGPGAGATPAGGATGPGISAGRGTAGTAGTAGAAGADGADGGRSGAGGGADGGRSGAGGGADGGRSGAGAAAAGAGAAGQAPVVMLAAAPAAPGTQAGAGGGLSSPTVARRDGGARPAPVVGGPKAAQVATVATLLERVASHRAEVVSAGDQAKATLQAAADAETAQVRATADAETARIVAATEDGILAARQAAAAAESAVQTARNQEIGRINAEAEATLTALDNAVRDNQAAVRAAAERHAVAAIAGGDREAQRAVAGAQDRAARAVAIGVQRAKALEPTERGARKARAAREISQETAAEILKAGQETAGTARTDMAALAGKFRSEGAETAERMAGEDLSVARQRVVDRRAAAVSAVEQAAEQTLARVASDRDAVVEQFRADQAATGDVARAAAAAVAVVGQARQAGVTGVESAVAEVTSGLDEASAVADGLTGVPAADLTAAAVDLDAAVAEFLGELDRLVGGSADGMGFATATASDGMRQLTEMFVGPVAQTANDFVQRTGDAATAAVDGMKGQAGETIAEYTRIREGVTGTLARTVTGADREWATQETNGLGEVTRKVGEGLTAQQKMLDEVGKRIDERAAEIEDESWWDRAVGFVAGFVVGFLATAWDMIKVLAIVALAVLVLVVVALVIGALIAGLAGIAAVFGALAAIGAFIASISTVLLVIGAVVVAGIVAYKLYRAFADDSLSPYERGKLVGSATFDVASLVLGAKFAAWAGRLFGLGVAAEASADAAALARLRALIGDEMVLERLLAGAGGDAVKLERLLAATGSDATRLEALLTAVGGDAAKLEGLLTAVGGDAARLERLLAAAGGDAGRLERILTAVGGDAVKLESMLATVGGDAARLERLLAAAGGDAAKLERMLTAVGGDATKLEEMVAAAGGDAAKLEVMLGGLKTPQAARAATLEAVGDVPAATPIAEISEGQPLAMAISLYDRVNPEIAADLRTAYHALTDAEQVADTVARVQARAIDLAAQGSSEPFAVALRGVDGKLTTLHLDLTNEAEAFLAALMDMSKRNPGEVVTLLPGQLELQEAEFFLRVVTKGEPFLDVSAIVQTAPEHGAASHLLQDLIVDNALSRAGSRMNSVQLRAALATPPAESELLRAFAWEKIWDPLDNVLNNPGVLNTRLRQVFGDLDKVLIKIDAAWAARYAEVAKKAAAQ